MAMMSTQISQKLNPQKTWQRRIDRQISAAAATAQTFTFDIPRDHFIHEVHVTVYENTAITRDPTKLVDDLDAGAVQLIANGNKYLKDGIGSMFKQVMMINQRAPQTGLYTLFFSDPMIQGAKPLPSWIFTSLQLKVTDNAPAASNYHTIEVVVTESAYENQDLQNWSVLVEKYSKWQKYGTNTGEQVYDHERASTIYGYLYLMDDDGTASASIYDLMKLIGRKPSGELTIIDVPVPLLKAENDAEIGIDTLDTGYIFLAWKQGLPANEFSSLYSKPNIPSAGTNAGLRVLERYVLA
jgi:hypothetical protein